MKYDVVVFGETQAANGLTGNAAVADALYSASGDTITIRDIENGILFGILAHGANMQRYKLDFESFLVDLDIWGGAVILSEKFNDLHQPSIKFPSNELITGYVDNLNNNEASDIVLLIAYETPPKLSPIPLTDDLKPITVVGATTLTAYTWESITTTWPTLPQGIYEIWGCNGGSATGIAYRIIPKTGDLKYNVGLPCMDVPVYFDKPIATFDQKNKPIIDWLAVTTDAAEYLTLYLKKVG